MFQDNPEFKLLFESKVLNKNGMTMISGEEPLRFYTHSDPSKYHTSRYVAATAQNMYASAGLTPEILNEICDQMINAVNSKNIANCAILANNLKYRTKYPVDENAILRMAMIYCFVDGENPDKCENHWTEWKLKAILSDPEAYSFFLPIGIQFTPAYNQYSAEISSSSLNQRRETLKTLHPLSEHK